MTIETDPRRGVAHRCFPAGEHDSLQYHFFGAGMVVSIRVFRTASLERHFVWLYDGREIRELLCTAEPIDQRSDQYLDLGSRGLRITAQADSGRISVLQDAEPILAVEFQVRDGYTYLPTEQQEPVTHLPNLSCTIGYEGSAIKGTGYCKRYFGHYPRTWGYRFIHCSMPPVTTWAADALFGDNKYCYMHLLPDHARLLSSLNATSEVSSAGARATIADKPAEVRLERIATWETRLRSDAMDSLLEQHVCRARLDYDNRVFTGLCLNEVCTGSLA